MFHFYNWAKKRTVYEGKCVLCAFKHFSADQLTGEKNKIKLTHFQIIDTYVIVMEYHSKYSKAERVIGVEL